MCMLPMDAQLSQLSTGRQLDNRTPGFSIGQWLLVRAGHAWEIHCLHYLYLAWFHCILRRLLSRGAGGRRTHQKASQQAFRGLYGRVNSVCAFTFCQLYVRERGRWSRWGIEQQRVNLNYRVRGITHCARPETSDRLLARRQKRALIGELSFVHSLIKAHQQSQTLSWRRKEAAQWERGSFRSWRRRFARDKYWTRIRKR